MANNAATVEALRSAAAEDAKDKMNLHKYIVADESNFDFIPITNLLDKPGIDVNGTAAPTYLDDGDESLEASEKWLNQNTEWYKQHVRKWKSHPEWNTVTRGYPVPWQTHFITKVDRKDAKAEENPKNPPLVEAIFMGRDDIVEMLLARDDIDVNVTDPQCTGGRGKPTPLVQAILSENQTVLDTLLKRDDVLVDKPSYFLKNSNDSVEEDNKKPMIYTDLNDESTKKRLRGMTALQLAVQLAEETTLRKLLDKGASPNGVYSYKHGSGGHLRSKETPLIRAFQWRTQDDDSKMLDMLLARENIDIGESWFSHKFFNEWEQDSLLHRLLSNHTEIARNVFEKILIKGAIKEPDIYEKCYDGEPVVTFQKYPLVFKRATQGFETQPSKEYVEFASDRKCHNVSKDQGRRGTCYLYSFINLFANERVILHALKELCGWKEDREENPTRGEPTVATPEPILEIVKMLTHFKYSPSSCPRIPKWMKYYVYGNQGGWGRAPDGGFSFPFAVYTLLACEKVYPQRFRTFLEHRSVEVYIYEQFSALAFNASLKEMCDRFTQSECNIGGCMFEFKHRFELTSERLNPLTSFPCVRSFVLSIDDAHAYNSGHAVNGFVCTQSDQPTLKLCNTWREGCLDAAKGSEELNSRGEFSRGEKNSKMMVKNIFLLLRRDD